ncbi:MAG TPA: hypothetical protein VKJ77_03890, partial [Caballeronia sp.]|nr:hypothetical protein [Caballeronia sp.]
MNEQLVTKPVLRSVSSPISPSAPSLGRRWIDDHHRWLAVAALLLLLAVAGALWWSFDRAPAMHYSTVVATQGDVVRAVTATGTVNPELTIIVGSYVSGVIQSLSC